MLIVQVNLKFAPLSTFPETKTTEIDCGFGLVLISLEIFENAVFVVMATDDMFLDPGVVVRDVLAVETSVLGPRHSPYFYTL